MAKPSVEFHSEAEAEYLAALSWYEEHSPVAARKFEAELSRSIEQIRSAPEPGSPASAGVAVDGVENAGRCT